LYEDKEYHITQSRDDDPLTLITSLQSPISTCKSNSVLAIIIAPNSSQETLHSFAMDYGNLGNLWFNSTKKELYVQLNSSTTKETSSSDANPVILRQITNGEIERYLHKFQGSTEYCKHKLCLMYLRCLRNKILLSSFYMDPH
jgi:hypothetical protein